MNGADFELFAGLLKQRSGLVLTPEKTYLLESRLLPLARKRGLPDLAALAARMRAQREEELLRDITEAMTTNESFFFRDSKPFEVFRKETLPELLRLRADRRQIRIWSAACSTGQEPYSLAMILKEEQARLAGWQIDIVATDLAGEVLEKARGGIYTQFEVQRGLPIQLMMKYFTQVGEQWQLAQAIRGMVQFRQLNLLSDFSALGPFDVVFCRNVLIYFDQATKAAVLERISRQLTPGGVLYLGGAETVLGVSEKFKPLAGQRGVYGIAA